MPRSVVTSQLTDCHVISVAIAEGELAGLRVGIHVRFVFEASDERACSFQRKVEVIDAEE